MTQTTTTGTIISDNEKPFKQMQEQFEEYNRMNPPRGLNHPCSSCGYCPHCGRGGHQTYPYYPNYPWQSPWVTYTYSDTNG